MTDLTFESLAERLQRVERQNRWLRTALIMAVAVFAAVVCMGQVGVPKVVRAHGFEMVDAQGEVRGSLALADGRPALALLDDKGNMRTALSLEHDGRPPLQFYDDRDKRRVSLKLGPDGGPTLGFYDGKGTGRCSLMLESDGRPAFGLLDEKGKVLWKAPPD